MRNTYEKYDIKEVEATFDEFFGTAAHDDDY